MSFLLPSFGGFIYTGLSAHQKILRILQDTSQVLPISSMKISSEPLNHTRCPWHLNSDNVVYTSVWGGYLSWSALYLTTCGLLLVPLIRL